MTAILIADDVSENRYMLLSLLKGYGYEVVSASDGEEALNIALNSPPDLIITDILMPVMDGFELCRKWKQNDILKDIPFIVYTATYTDPKDERLALSIGADRFVIKPQKIETLIKTVKEVLAEATPTKSSKHPITESDEIDYLNRHNEALFRKLEKKVAQLKEEIQERYRIEKELQESTAMLRIAGKMIKLGAWSVNLENNTVHWSENVSAIHEVEPGYCPTVEEGIAFYAPIWRDKIAELFYACAQNGTPYDEEMQIITAKGKLVWVRTAGEAIRDESGKIVKVQGAFQDITNRKKEEEERQCLQKQLLESQKLESIGRLAGGVAHDFNNMLSVIINYADFALQMTKDQDVLNSYIDEIKKAGVKAATLTHQLLAFSRKQIVEPKIINLNESVSDMQNMLRRLLGEHIEISVQLQENLGTVRFDPGQIDQVLVNLAVNSRDAMPEGGRLVIETQNVVLDEYYVDQHAETTPGNYVMLAVTDSGCGISPSDKEKIFEPFFSTKAKGKGTGLGLSIVYGIVKQCGGNIFVYSEPGCGTAFKIYLPRIDDFPESANKYRRSSIPVGGGETILVVEDEDAVRTITERMLLAAGYNVYSFSSGKEALSFCESAKCKFDLLLTDVVMPKMSGRDLAECVVELCPAIKVLYMSGYTDNAIVNNGVLTPGTCFISKPFSLHNLQRKLRDVLNT